MKFDHLVALMPCRSLEEFPLQRGVDDAEQLLSAWCALWHPALLAHAQDTPRWVAAEEPPQDTTGHLIALPECCEPLLPSDWLAAAEQAGARLLRNLQRRDETVRAALEALEEAPPAVDPELAAEFLALGFCHFQVEMLTRQMRYSSNLDEVSFRAAALEAATAAVQGDAQAARRSLQSAYDRLLDSRQYFYPVEAHLLDLTLVAATTLGQSLCQQLRGSLPGNLMVPAELIEQISQQHPATLAALKEALANGTVGIIGGEWSDGPLPLLPPEAIRWRIERGLAAYERHLGVRPKVFGRRRYGLTPVLPQILAALGFVGAIHCTLDDGRFPVSNQSRVQWEGLDGTALEAIGRVPIDISRPDAFLRLPERLGSSMDLDYVATVLLAHWPGQSSPWFEDLRRIAQYTTALGTFSTIDDYFQRTVYTGQRSQYQADQYHSPYLQQAVTAGQQDPISRWVRYSGRRAALEAAEAFDLLAAAAATARRAAMAEAELRDRKAAREALFTAVEDALTADNDRDPALQRQIEQLRDDSLECFCCSLGPATHTVRSGYLVANPWSFSRRSGIELPELSRLPEVAGAVRAASETADKKAALIDVPAMGFAWIGAGPEQPQPQAAPPPRSGWLSGKKQPPAEPPVVEGHTLQNEFFQVRIDPDKGGIRAITAYSSRGPRLAQQLAMRLPEGDADDPGHDSHYSIMAADEATVTCAGPLLGEIVSRGRLLDRQGRRLAGFAQTTRLWRGSRIIELEIELDIDEQPGPNPWQSYYAARFAWGDPTADLYRSVNLANLPTDAERLEAPLFVDIRLDQQRTTLLCGGLPYHRRCGTRKLDTLLVVQGETERRFRLGIGIDLTHPVPAALGFLTPAAMRLQPAPPMTTGWLFHLDARNVVATHWEPLLAGARLEGFRVRLLETDGRSVSLGLRCFCAVQSACKIEAGNTPGHELPVDGDRVRIDIGSHAWVEVEVRLREA